MPAQRVFVAFGVALLGPPGCFLVSLRGSGGVDKDKDKGKGLTFLFLFPGFPGKGWLHKCS